jgi:hypothetical protein
MNERDIRIKPGKLKEYYMIKIIHSVRLNRVNVMEVTMNAIIIKKTGFGCFTRKARWLTD